MERSTWLSDMPARIPHSSLEREKTCDVVIVGGGLAGCMAAYLLLKEGKKVIVLDKGVIEDSTTAYTTAFITYEIDTEISGLVSMYGEEGARKVWQSGKAAIDLIEEIARSENIDCEFTRVPEYVFASTPKQFSILEEQLDTAKSLGFTDLKTCREHILPFKNSGAIEIPRQAKFHPLKFLIGLREAVVKMGGEIYEQTEVLDIKEGDGAVVAETKSGKVTGYHAVIATYQPFKNPPQLFARKGMYLSYVFEVELPRGTIPEGLYLDEGNPYYYFRIDAKDNGDRMIIGGEDHRKEIPLDPEKCFASLEDYVKKLIPGVPFRIVHKWSGGILETIDGLPYIGRFSKKHPRQLVITGFSGNGMTYSAIAGTIVRDIVLGKENPYEALYHAGRKTSFKNFFKKFIDFGEEFFGGAVKNIFKKTKNKNNATR